MPIRLLARALASLSTPALMRLGAVLGWIWYRLIPIRRKAAREALARAFPEKSAEERERILRINFVHLVRSLLEAIALIAYPEERLRKLVRFEGLDEAVDAARAAGKGIICLSAHQGSFEFCMGAYGIFRPEIPRVIIARIPKAGFARALLDAVRERTKIEVLAPKGSFRPVVKMLRDNRQILGFVADQNMARGRGVFVPFFGRLAGTTVGFSLIHRSSGAWVVPGWNERLEDGTHVGHWGPPIELSTHPNLKIALLEDAYRVSKITERWVRDRPEQWFWVHRRWKSQPRPGDVVRTDRGLEIAGKPGRIGVLLDRDGTINMELGRAVLHPDELALVPGAAEAIRRLNDAAIPVLVITNQAAIARGQIDEAGLEAIHARMRELLAKEGARVDAIYYCPHHPTEGRDPWRLECDCRKPAPGLVKKAQREWDLNLEASLFVGDRETDVKTARSCGMRVVVVSNGWTHAEWQKAEGADDVAPDLVKAVDSFLDRTLEANEA